MQYKRSFLITFFELFYSKVLENKVRLEKGLLFEKEEEEVSKKNKIANLQNNLINMIKEEANIISSENGILALANFQECSYIMIALADETFLNANWEEKKYWRNNLLEEQYFKSHNAGSSFFERLERFIEERDIQKSEIGILFLYALSLGFEGKFRNHIKKQEILSQIKDKLFKVINRKSPELYKKISPLFPQSQQFTIEPQKSFYDNTMRNLSILSVCLLCGFLFFAQTIWHKRTKQVWSITKESLKLMKEIR